MAIIDVFRAFTTAAVAMANGAADIVMVRTVEEALALRDAGIGQICMGEVHGRVPDGFDFGNLAEPAHGGRWVNHAVAMPTRSRQDRLWPV